MYKLFLSQIVLNLLYVSDINSIDFRENNSLLTIDIHNNYKYRHYDGCVDLSHIYTLKELRLCVDSFVISDEYLENKFKNNIMNKIKLHYECVIISIVNTVFLSCGT